MIFDNDVLIWFLRAEPNAVHLIDSTVDSFDRDTYGSARRGQVQ
jgi:hypothetical protein